MFLDRAINFFTSLKLTVVCLCLGLALVFFGTLPLEQKITTLFVMPDFCNCSCNRAT